MSDNSTTIEELRKLVRDFRNARDWEQFHDPKNLAEGLSIEAGELLEHFLWKEKVEIAEKLKNDPEYLEEVGDELADVLGYVLHMAEATGLDLSEVLRRKYAKNEKNTQSKKQKVVLLNIRNSNMPGRTIWHSLDCSDVQYNFKMLRMIHMENLVELSYGSNNAKLY